MQLDVYTIKKKYLYFYLDDVAKQQYLSFIKKYPSDEQLRRYFIEQQNWKDYFQRTRGSKSVLGVAAGNSNLALPKHVLNDVQRIEEIKEDVERQARLTNEVILPKINKKEQIKTRLMSWYQHDIPTMERKVANYKRV